MIEYQLRLCPECGLVNANGYMTCPACGENMKTKHYAVAYSDPDKLPYL